MSLPLECPHWQSHPNVTNLRKFIYAHRIVTSVIIFSFLSNPWQAMLTVLLVRHGETVHNVAKLFAGITDSEYFPPSSWSFLTGASD